MKVAAQAQFWKRAAAGWLACSALFFSYSSEAKELAGRFGFGVANIGGSLPPAVSADESTLKVAGSGAGSLPPSISVDWHPTNASELEFDLGIDTDSSTNFLLLGTRYFRHIFVEENALFSALLGGGILSQEVNGTSKSGYYLELGAGAKYFLPGAPNLAIGFIAALGVKSAGGVRFMTQGLFSIHYYF